RGHRHFFRSDRCSIIRGRDSCPKHDESVHRCRLRGHLTTMPRWRPLLLLCALLSATAGVTHAQELIDRRQQRREQRAADSISLDQAVQMAQSRYRAKAVRAETVTNGGRRVHRIRLLSPEGKVWMVRVDAQTGAMH